MGVEYIHYLIPENPSFIPADDVISKIDAVLKKWQLKTAEPKVYDLTNGIKNKAEADSKLLQQPLDTLIIGHGKGAKYKGIDGIMVAEVFGPSYFGDDIKPEERYVQDIHFITGTDYRIHPSGDELTMTIIKPPFENGVALHPFCDCDLVFYSFAEAYNCAADTVAPEVQVEAYNSNRLGQQNFCGFWRAALVIFFGKDMPELSDSFYAIPHKLFMADLEAAFGCPLIQVGSIC
jgi:hypothetical protein